MDQLAEDYAGQPVVFLEYDVDAAPYSRYGRWWAGYGQGGSVYLPLMMADSGHQISNGYVSFYNVYKGMVEAELARPPQAGIEAQWWRTGDSVNFYVRVRNLSPATLSYANAATVHAIVYEDAHVYETDRFVRTTASTSISELAPNASETFTLATAALSGVNWANLHYLVAVDYRPGGASGAFDMLQAAVAQPASFTVEPESLTVMVDPADPADPARALSLVAPSFNSWTAVSSAAWLTVTPPGGPVSTPPVLTVNKGALVAGWQQATVTFTANDGVSTDEVTVNAYLGTLRRVYVPVVER